MPVPPQLANVASIFHKLSILLFGYFIPALSSVKSVVRKDSEAYHQWSTYWLILHLYITILSPFLHLTLHPIFQILAVLWLSLPQYQGASVVYERIVVPWVDEYESRVDEAVDEAHRGVRRWAWSRFGSFVWLLMGEGGSLAQGLLNVIMGFLGCNEIHFRNSREDVSVKPSDSAEPLPRRQARHSIKEALSQSTSFSEVDDVNHASFDPTGEFVHDFMSMLQQGLYVFANVDTTRKSPDDGDDQLQRNQFEGGFKLGIFSYTTDERGAFLISPVAEGAKATGLTSVVLRLDTLKPLRPTGAQGVIFEVDSINGSNKGKNANIIRAEIVLSDESDRNILLNGLNACLPYTRSGKKNK